MPLFLDNRSAKVYCPRTEQCMANETNSLAHTKWMCKYKGVEIVEGHMAATMSICC